TSRPGDVCRSAAKPPVPERSRSSCPPRSRSARPRSHGRAGSSCARVRGSSAAAARIRRARSSGGAAQDRSALEEVPTSALTRGVRYSISIVASSKDGRAPTIYNAPSSAARCVTERSRLRWRRRMSSDRFGYPLTTASEEAAEHYRRAVDCMLSANIGAADALDAALHADPDFALARAAKARWLQLYMRIPEAQAEAAAARALRDR